MDDDAKEKTLILVVIFGYIFFLIIAYCLLEHDKAQETQQQRQQEQPNIILTDLYRVVYDSMNNRNQRSANQTNTSENSQNLHRPSLLPQFSLPNYDTCVQITSSASHETVINEEIQPAHPTAISFVLNDRGNQSANQITTNENPQDDHRTPFLPQPSLPSYKDYLKMISSGQNQ